MSPALIPGAVVLMARRTAHRGDVVLAQSKGGEVLKRVVTAKGSNLTLANDNGAPHREMIARSAVLGVVVFALPGASVAPRPHMPFARVVASACAAVYIVMALTQLFAFDKFIELLDENWLPHDISGVLLGALLVSLTVMAIPYLLHMSLSLAARLISQIAGWLVALLWLGIGFLTEAVGQGHASTGHLSTLVDTPPGVWTVVFGGVLLSLVVISSWMLGGTRYVRDYTKSK